jgi:hypothetical protein
MAETWTKLLGSIVDSSISREDHVTFRVWIILLAKADRDGYVWASVGGLADAARVTDEQCQAALDKFMSPDPHSRSEDFGGRRIQKVERGWLLLNHARFRDMRDEDAKREEDRKRQRDHRRKKREEREALAAAEREDARVNAQREAEPADDFNGSPNETICPANLLEQATPKVLPELAAKLKGATLEQVTASANRFCSYYVIGKGMGQKRRFWMRELRNWVTKDHGSNKLSNGEKPPRNVGAMLAERAERLAREEAERNAKAAE